MKAEIMAVGTELLLGDIINTNAQFLSKELAAMGIDVYYQSVVGDNPDRLYKALEQAFERADMVITTGGLGPTKDDLTKETGAKFFGRKMVLNEKAMEELKSYFDGLGRQMTKNNEKQAYLPEGAIAIPNNNGTAPGCIIENNGKRLVMLPGPPFEMEPMFKDFVAQYLMAESDHKYISRSLRIIGVGESKAEEVISDLIESQSNPTIAPYAKNSEMLFRITASAHDEKEAEKIMQPVIDELYRRFGTSIYGEGETSLEEVIIRLLNEKGLKLAVAESCTGGMVTSKLIDCAGASAVLLEGVVTYANESKIKRLSVKAETLEKYGAVSHETAREMAEGVCVSSGADIGISTTGIAGPGGGTDEKPVGLVYIGLCIKGKVSSYEFQFKGSRQRIRTRTAVNALDILRRGIINE
ncbi:MAG: competence/damage-inducible protein A [Lachnospiraceae bacterium]|jgi:nicotinamide-nucleotide amidase|nr:competence/damage-inducible protein A [Lachnospiraceae bacterium]